MAGAGPMLDLLADNDFATSSESRSHSPHISRVTTIQYPGDSLVSKIRPVEGNSPTRQPDIVGESWGQEYQQSRNKVAPFDPANDGRGTGGFPHEILISPPSTTSRSSAIQDTSPQGNSSEESHSSVVEPGPNSEGKNELAMAEKDDSEALAGMPWHMLKIPISKVRPCVLEPTSETHASNYPTFGPKVQLALLDNPNPNSSGTTSGPFSFEQTTLSSVKHVSCRGDSFSTVGSHEGHHHASLPKQVTAVTSGDHSIDNCPTSYSLSLTSDKSLSRPDEFILLPSHSELSSGEVLEVTDIEAADPRASPMSKSDGATLDDYAQQISPPSNTRSEGGLAISESRQAAEHFATLATNSPVLYAPIPVSKLRPSFQTDYAADSQARGHSSIPKVGPFLELLGETRPIGRS